MTDRRTSSRPRRALTGPDAAPLDVRAHHLLCAVCARGGCRNPPPGKRIIGPLLDALGQYPYVLLRILADVDVNRAHYLDVYAGRGKPRPAHFRERAADYVGRRKDLEVCRRLGIVPNSVLPAFLAYSILFQRAPTLAGICASSSPKSRAWPECRYARKGDYEKIARGKPRNLHEQTALGEAMGGKGLWALFRPRTRADMRRAKTASARFIVQRAERLFIRPEHLLCILCAAPKEEPLIEDNLVELRKRMEASPDVPVTLSEGCCMVCDPCNVYHPGEHLCYHGHIKNQLRDLHMLEKLGLPPGATLPARELYRRIYAHIGSLQEICGWGDELATAPFWAPCGGYRGQALDAARRAGLMVKGKR